MAVLDEHELRAREDAFMKAHAPDTYGFVLDQLRPSLYRLHAAGYSRAMLFTFLSSEGLVACGRATFYRWLRLNVDLDAGARAALADRTAGRSALATSDAQPRQDSRRSPNRTQSDENVADSSGGNNPDLALNRGGSANGAAEEEGRVTAQLTQEAADAGSAPIAPAPVRSDALSPLASTYKSTVESTQATDGHKATHESLRILNDVLRDVERADVGSAAARARSRQAASTTSPGARDP